MEKLNDRKLEEWTSIKAIIRRRDHIPPFFKEGEVWWCHEGENVGVEICGKGMEFIRPILIFKKYDRYSFFGLPLSTKSKTGSWYAPVTFRNMSQTVILAQGKTMDYRRLKKKIGELDEKELAIITISYRDLHIKINPPQLPAEVVGQPQIGYNGSMAEIVVNMEIVDKYATIQLMNRTYIKDIPANVGKEIVIKGWIDVRRDMGKLIFLDVRDMTGRVQAVALPNHKEVQTVAGTLRSEWVVEVKGKVNARPEKTINKNEVNGAVELEILEIKVLNRAETPPIDVRGEGSEIGEDSRLTYRYLDLRRPRMQKNIRVRNDLNLFIRNFLVKEGFTEIETPLLSKSTPEGSRDFLVPSRLEPGKFYALPQSPQQYKQLLMAAGFEKYFQIARCMRDEDTRGDRQPEFTQLDLEMSFVEREDVMDVNERLLIALVSAIAPQKKIQQKPFPRISYKEAMEKYGSDKPDLRRDKNDPNLLAFCWVIDFPFFEEVKDEKGAGTAKPSTTTKQWTFTHNPFSAPKPEHMEWLMKKEKIGEILTTQYDIALNGFEIGGGSIRNHQSEALKKVFEIMGHESDKIRENFGHMLDAFSFGAPPHGGIAWGLDRLMAILQNEPNIREVIAFPKNGEGKDLMMSAPSDVDKKQLDELGLEIKKVKERGKKK